MPLHALDKEMSGEYHTPMSTEPISIAEPSSQQSTWNMRYAALERYGAREGTVLVPSSYVDDEGVKLGSWVSYLRTRYRWGRLTEDKINLLEKLPGWQWGPLRPGPSPNTVRNQSIAQMRSEGMSFGQIGLRFQLSRQRIHQILTEGATRGPSGRV